MSDKKASKKETQANQQPSEDIFTTPYPDIVTQSAQLVFPPDPMFERLDMIKKPLESFEEIKSTETISQLTDKARSYIPFLYSYRSISKALNNENLPSQQCIIKEALQNGKKDELDSLLIVFTQIFEQPFQKLCSLVEFAKNAVEQLTKILDLLEEPTDVFFEHMTQFFDVLFNIDTLKMNKTGITNDLSFFKRNKSYFDKDPTILQQVGDLQMFLASRNQSLISIRDSIATIEKENKNSKIYHLFEKYLDYCVKVFNDKNTLPKRKNSIALGIMSACFIHGSKNNKLNIYNSPSAIAALQILAENPIIPLYADNTCLVGNVIHDSEGHNAAKSVKIPSSVAEIAKLKDKYLIVKNISSFRDMYRKNQKYAKQLVRDGKSSVESLLSLVKCVAEMSSAVINQFSFKMIVINSDEHDEKVTQYDRGVKYNYSIEDKNSLVELIGYIKSLSCSILSAEDAIVEFTSKFINNQIQEFVQNAIERPLVRANDADDSVAMEILSNIRNLYGNWNGKDPMKGLPKSTKKIKPHDIKETMAPVSNNQLDILRIETAHLVNPDSIFLKKQGAFRNSHFRPKHIGIANEFLQLSTEFYTLNNYCNTLREESNLSALWFRESSIEIDNVLQFPVRSSLPFILAEHLLSNSDQPALHDSMLYPFEIYNDAAFAALNTFQSQYLYREIEAEVTLCIDMIAFTFSETFYRNLRETAAVIELPAETIGTFIPTPTRYNIIVRQNKLQLLGSAVDFNLVATEKLNTKMRRELESYVAMLTDLRFTPYVHHLVRVAKTTHDLLTESNLNLDPFEQLWQRAKGFTNPLSLESHLASRLLTSLDLPHYKYNCITNRFIVTKDLELKPPTNENWALEYVKLHTQETKYIGIEHIQAIQEILSPGELSFFIQQLFGLLEEEVIKMIDIYTTVAPALRMLPAISKNELAGYYNFNSDAYGSVNHPQLGAYFNSLRVIGNIIGFLWSLETLAIVKTDTKSFLSPLMSIVKKYLLYNNELFMTTSALDLESPTTHRSFPSLWTILEFVYCSPNKIKISDEQRQPYETFGDGPIIAAHTFISLLDQVEIYEFDSMCSRATQLEKAEHAKDTTKDLATFYAYASAVGQAKNFARLIASPFKIEP